MQGRGRIPPRANSGWKDGLRTCRAEVAREGPELGREWGGDMCCLSCRLEEDPSWIVVGTGTTVICLGSVLRSHPGLEGQLEGGLGGDQEGDDGIPSPQERKRRSRGQVGTVARERVLGRELFSDQRCAANGSSPSRRRTGQRCLDCAVRQMMSLFPSAAGRCRSGDIPGIKHRPSS